MKQMNVIFAALILCVLSIAAAQENCSSIETTGPKGSVPITVKRITHSGKYCLFNNFRAPRTYFFSEGGERTFPNYVLSIASSDVIVDLHGYTLEVDTRGMGGVETGYWEDTLPHQRITIRNGIVKSRSASVINFNTPQGSIYSDFKVIHSQTPKLAEFYKSYFGINDIAEEELQRLLKILPKKPEAYVKTEYLIENVKIESGSVADYVGTYRIAIGMKGASNIIRNSTIEVTDGHAAIYLFGPNQLIENNIIIFKGRVAVESAAAIKLHQADGSIIRNNDIIIESSGDDAPKAAISLIDSKNVVVEGNRTYGIKTLMHAWDDKSNIIDRSNEFRAMLRRPWTSGEPGVH